MTEIINFIARALEQALKGRLHILKIMLETLAEPRKNLSKYAPKIITFFINPDKIREVIGPGGKMINKIIADTGVKIDIEDDGRVGLVDDRRSDRIAPHDHGAGRRQLPLHRPGVQGAG